MATRVIPITGTDIQRKNVLAAGLLLPTELTTTRDQKRVFFGGEYPVGPTYLGTVTTEAAMRALNAGSRGCFPMDVCYRSDTSSLWICVSNRGALLTDWKNLGAVGGEGGIGNVVGPSTSVDSELPLYDATTGKLLKRSTGTGFVKVLAGVVSYLSSIGTSELAAEAVTYAKIQNISATSRILARKTAAAGSVEECTASEILDFLGATRGSILYRGASGWTILTPGTSGYYLKSNGPGADPTYEAVSGGAASSTLTDLILGDSPTAYWKCAEASGSLLDSSGNGHTLAVTGTPTRSFTRMIRGLANEHIYWNGSATQYASANDNLGDAVPWTGSWSLEFCIMIPSASGADVCPFAFGKTSDETEAANYQIYCAIQSNRSPYLIWEYSTGVNVQFTANYVLPVGELAHIVWTKDATAKVVNCYVNGIKVASGTYTQEPTGGSTGILSIGLNSQSGTPQAVFAHVAIYMTTILTGEKIMNRAIAAGLA